MKKIRCILLIAVLCFSLMSCATTPPAAEEPQTQSPASEASPAQESANASSATSTPTKEELEQTQTSMGDLMMVQADPLPKPSLPIVEEPLTLSVLYPRLTQHGDFSDMWLLNEIQKETNIWLDVIPVETSAWPEKKNLAFASGDYGDIFLSGLSLSEAAQYGMAGMLQPLNDLMAEHSPNSTSLLRDIFPDSTKNLSATDGNIYLMPAFVNAARDNVVLKGFLNNRWLEQAGLEMPKTLDEMYNALVAIRDGDGNGNGEADEIPLSFVYDGDKNDNAVIPILTAFGFVHPRHDVIDNQYVYVPMHDNFRAYLSFLNKLYNENLLDKEVFTQTTEQYNAKMSAYRLGMFGLDPKDFLPVPEQKQGYRLVGALTSEYNQTPMFPAQATETVTTGAFNITDKCKDPVAAIKLLDYMYSDEASFIIKCGPEKGAIEGEGGWIRTTDANGSNSYVIDYDMEKYNAFYSFRCAHGLMNMPFFFTTSAAELVLGSDPDAMNVSLQAFDSGAFDDRRFGYPDSVTFTQEEIDTLASYILLDNYVDQQVAKFVTGALDVNDDSAWNDYIRNLEMMDAQTMIRVRQTAYDRWNSKTV